jgi:hypothetical protein
MENSLSLMDMRMDRQKLILLTIGFKRNILPVVAIAYSAILIDTIFSLVGFVAFFQTLFADPEINDQQISHCNLPCASLS